MKKFIVLLLLCLTLLSASAYAKSNNQIFLPFVSKAPPRVPRGTIEELATGVLFTDIEETSMGLLASRIEGDNLINLSTGQTALDVKDVWSFEVDSNNRLYASYKVDEVMYVSYWDITPSGYDPANEVNMLVLPLERGASHPGGDMYHDGTYLWVTTGDGSGQGDPNFNAQNVTRLAGAILRIDPYMTSGVAPTCGQNYLVPNDNPRVGNPVGCNELMVKGLRHPWRFDIVGSKMVIADVGYTAIESVFEYDMQADSNAFHNYGWPCFEGGQLILDSSACDGIIPRQPLLTYPHDTEYCAITGAVDLGNNVLTTDYCNGKLVSRAKSTGHVNEIVADFGDRKWVGISVITDNYIIGIVSNPGYGDEELSSNVVKVWH